MYYFCTLYIDIGTTWIEAFKLCLPDFDNIGTDTKLKNVFIDLRNTAKFIVKVMLKRKLILIIINRPCLLLHVYGTVCSCNTK